MKFSDLIESSLKWKLDRVDGNEISVASIGSKEFMIQKLRGRYQVTLYSGDRVAWKGLAKSLAAAKALAEKKAKRLSPRKASSDPAFKFNYLK